MSNRRLFAASAVLLLAAILLGWSTLFAAEPGPVENASQTDNYSEYPQAAAFGTSVRVVWGERGFNATFYKDKANSTSPFGNFQAFEEGAAQYQLQPDITITPDGVTHVISGAGNNVYYRNSKNWSQRVSVGGSSGANGVRISANPNDSNQLWAAWRDVNGVSITAARSTNGGQNWTTTTVTNEGANIRALDIATGPDGVPHIVWYLLDSGKNAGAFRYADWNGNGWSLGTGIRGAYNADPVIVVDKNNIQHIAYRRLVDSSSNRWAIQHATRAPGQAWGNEETIRTTTGDAFAAPSLAVDQLGGVHVTWSEPNNQSGRDVWYSVKEAGKSSYTTPALVNTERSRFNSRTALVTTLENGTVVAHVFFQREGGGAQAEIYYRPFRTIVATPTPVTPTPTPVPCFKSGTPVPVTPIPRQNKEYFPLVPNNCQL